MPGWTFDLGPAGPLGGAFWERRYGPIRAVVEGTRARPGYRWRLVRGDEAKYPFDLGPNDAPALAYGEALIYESAMAAADAAAERRLRGETIGFEPGMRLSPDDARRALLQLPDGRLFDVVSDNRLTRDTIVAESAELLRLKGKSEPVPAFRLVEVVAVAPAHVPRMGSPMVGRRRQLSQLRQAFEAAAYDRACQLFTILGPAGVGKSRLVDEFLASLGDATVLRGRCLPYGEGITYFPVLEVVKQAAGLADFDSPELVETKICAVLAGEEHQDRVCESVAQLFGLASGAAPEETRWAIRRFLEAKARERPIVLVFDDIHWGEPTFLDLVEHVADWSRDAPILLACMARPDLLDLRPAWSGGKLNAATVSLEPLTQLESEELIANLLGAAEVTENLLRKIAEAAEGNPLFVEEMLAMLIDDGLLRREEGQWVSTRDLSRIELPPTITALLAARLDQLSSAERDVLERASVVGKLFYRGAVRALFGEAVPEDLDELLMALVRRELVRPERSTLPGEDSFRFRHQLIRDAAYEAVSKALRAELHERFAEWLERVAGEQIAEQEEILGYHLEQAYRLRAELGPVDELGRDLARDAAGRLASAGQRAFRRGDMPAAIGLFDRAASLLPGDDPARLELFPNLAFALSQVGQLARAEATLSEALERARAGGQRAIELHALVLRSWLQMTVNPEAVNLQELAREAERAIHVFEELGDDLGLARAWNLLHQVRWGEYVAAGALEGAERAAHYARRAGSPQEVAWNVASLGWYILDGPTPVSEGHVRLEKASRDAGGERSTEAILPTFVACLDAMSGRFDSARHELALGGPLIEDLGLRWHTGFHTLLSGRVEVLGGKWGAAERLARLAGDLFRGSGDIWFLVIAEIDLARALYEQGRYAEALQPLDAVEKIAVPYDPEVELKRRGSRAKLLAREGAFDQAEALAREAIDLDVNREFLNFVGDAFLDLAEVLQLAGRRDGAAVAASEALELFERKENVVLAGKARALLAELGTGAPP